MVIALLLVSVCAFGVSVYAANEQYDKSSYVSFASVVLPDKCDNITFAKTKIKEKLRIEVMGKLK